MDHILDFTYLTPVVGVPLARFSMLQQMKFPSFSRKHYGRYLETGEGVGFLKSSQRSNNLVALFSLVL